MVKFAHSRQFTGRDVTFPKLHCVALGSDENFYGHPGEGAGAADEAAGHRDRLPDVPRDRDRDQIEAPRLQLVGSKVIQPAPGTKTSAHAWVDPAPVDPTLPCSGL